MPKQGRSTNVLQILFPIWRRSWATGLLTLVLCFGGLGFYSTAVLAASVPLTKQPPIVKKIGLGTRAGDLVFIPNHLTFKAGSRYQLTLHNDSPVKHYFTAKDFADAIWSQKVDAGNVEVKGAIHETCCFISDNISKSPLTSFGHAQHHPSFEQ